MAIEGFLALIRDQVMGKQPRVPVRVAGGRAPHGSEEGFPLLLEQDPSIVHQICLELDVSSICRLQQVCKQLLRRPD